MLEGSWEVDLGGLRKSIMYVLKEQRRNPAFAESVQRTACPSAVSGFGEVVEKLGHRVKIPLIAKYCQAVLLLAFWCSQFFL